MKLVIIGGSGPSTIFGQADVGDGMDGVVLTGYLPDEALPALLSGAIGLVFPSLYEGFGLPIVEAMACGAPVITTRCGSLPEVAGDAALYVDAVDPDDLASQMICLRNDSSLRADLAAKGLERARLFSWDTAAAKYQDVFARFC